MQERYAIRQHDVPQDKDRLCHRLNASHNETITDMERISFSDGLAISSIILTIILLVLDKAGKLKGPFLYGLLALAACMALPLVFSFPWVTSAPVGMPLNARRLLMFFIVGAAYSLLMVWITPSNPSEPTPNPVDVETTTSVPPPDRASPRPEPPHPLQRVGSKAQHHRQSAPAINIAPNGFAVSGGTLINPTINNGPPPRRVRHLDLSDTDRQRLIEYLNEKPAKVELLYLMGSTEAYNYAKEWSELLASTKWELMYQGTIHPFIYQGDAWTGAMVGFYGKGVTPGTPITISSDTPEGHLASALDAVRAGKVLFDSNPDDKDQHIILSIGMSEEVAPSTQ